MSKMATDTFSTFPLYLVENIHGMVRVREWGHGRCLHGDVGGGVFTVFLWRNSK